MDNTLEIKKTLIERIKSSKNITFLNALQTLFDSAEEELFELNENQINDIELGRKDIQKGNFKTNDDVFNEMKTWLKKK